MTPPKQMRPAGAHPLSLVGRVGLDPERGIRAGSGNGAELRAAHDRPDAPEPCNHVDSYGSMVMEGGPQSRYPGQQMCIGCDERAPFLRVVA